MSKPIVDEVTALMHEAMERCDGDISAATELVARELSRNITTVRAVFNESVDGWVKQIYYRSIKAGNFPRQEHEPVQFEAPRPAGRPWFENHTEVLARRMRIGKTGIWKPLAEVAFEDLLTNANQSTRTGETMIRKGQMYRAVAEAVGRGHTVGDRWEEIPALHKRFLSEEVGMKEQEAVA